MGLLDVLNSDQGRLGLGLLAAAAPTMEPMNFAGRLGMFGQQMDRWKQDALRQKFIQSQIDENASQADVRRAQLEAARQKLAFDQYFMGGAGLFGAGGGAQSAAPALGASPAAPDQVAADVYTKPPVSAQTGLLPGAGTPGGAGRPAGAGFTAQQISQQFGVPLEAVLADYKFNGGKKIAELIAERTKPNWVNVNGNLVNTNTGGFAGGLQAGVSAGSDGRVTMWQPDGRGGLVVGAPRGALTTYGAYRGIDEGTKADYDPVTVTPQGEPPQMTTRGSLVRNPALQGARIAPARQASMDAQRLAILRQEETKAQAQLTAALAAGDQSAAARAQMDLAAVRRELGGASATVGLPLQSEEEKLRATRGVEGDAKTNEARANDIKTAKKFISIADTAEAVLKTGPTASGVGSLVDSGLAFFGKSTKGAEAAQQLKALGGWLVANVPRMEGPQSNFDVGNYQKMAADVANDMLPVERRMAALKTIKQMMQNTIDGGAQGDFSTPGQSAKTGESAVPAKPAKTVVKTGTYGGKKVVQYSDGSVEYAN